MTQNRGQHDTAKPSGPDHLLSLSVAPRLARGVALAVAALAAAGAPLLAGENGTVGTAASVSASIPDYRLGPLDKITLRAVEWRPSRDEVYEWKALNAEYAVGPAGRVFLPLIGEVDAAGLTVGELSKSVGVRLQERLGLASAPDISVEVVVFRPFYVTGDVQKPGEYAFRPELSVLQSVTLASGLVKDDEARAASARRAAISTRGELSLLAGELNSLLARKARLDAELSEQSEIKFPAALVGRSTENSIALLLAHERRLHQTRRESFDTQIRALEQLKAHLDKEITSLNARLEVHDSEVALVRQEFDNIRGLHDKGLVTSPRKMGLERNLAQYRGDRIRLETEIARARQEVSRTTITLLELKNKRATDLTTESQRTREQLELVLRKSDTAERIAREVELRDPLLVSVSETAPAGPAVKYTIVRRFGAQTVEVGATESTRVQPGDAIKVEIVAGGGAMIADPSSRGGLKANGFGHEQMLDEFQKLTPAHISGGAREEF